ncbi:MAG: hypothetical protein QW727_02590 [Candidatus Pacearchaeota archaeon]
MVKFKEAAYYKKLPNKKVRCMLCPHNCIINNGESGKCKVKMNIIGSLKAMNYSRPYAVKIEKIEDVPIFHFLPKSNILSVGVHGYNLEDPFNEYEFYGMELSNVPTLLQKPDKIIEQAELTKTKIIVYRYSEPFMSYEYIREIIKKSKNIKNIIVTRGFIESEPVKEIINHIDAILFEITSMNESFHSNILKGDLGKILKIIKLFYDYDVWIEIKFNLIEEIHNDLYDIRKLVSWILNNLNSNVPLIINAKRDSINSFELVKKSRKIAKDAGINFVYTYGIDFAEGKITFCPNCNVQLIHHEKNGFNHLKEGKCSCGKEIIGFWE